MRVTLFLLIQCSIYAKYIAVERKYEKCGTIHGKRIRRHDHEVFPRETQRGSKYGKALEFDAGTAVHYSDFVNPSKKFSVDFWMRANGGQKNPAIIIHAYDKCSPSHETRGWSIALRQAENTGDVRLTFTVHTASSHVKTTIWSHAKVEPSRWYHVAATYDGRRMKLYVNDAKVAVGRGQKGAIFDTSSQGHSCDQLEVGGDVRNGFYYRGQIDKLRLWSEVITHRRITQSLPQNSVNSAIDKISLYDNYNDATKPKWMKAGKIAPRFVRSTVPDGKHEFTVKKPPCGKTVCDNPEIIKSYLHQPGGRNLKRLRMRFINLMADDGSRAMLEHRKIESQYRLTLNAFKDYNISWKMEISEVRNTRLRDMVVLYSCELSQIGNDVCEEACNHVATGWDGGDCKRMKCPPKKTGNGVCDPVCNTAKYKYDGGDCCSVKTNQNCVDPESKKYRRYLSLDDYKRKIGISNRDALNVYVVEWTDRNLQGIATLPWDKTIHTELGGITLPLKNFGKTEVLVHEIGHILGLWHIHHGSQSEMLCSDDCFEAFPSMELGDLCSDTNPTIQHTSCSDPVVTADNSCGVSIYTNTSYNNYMSYADGSCTSQFTAQQVARMHCYIDLDYQSWQPAPKPSFIPLQPHVIWAKKDRIKLSWLPPLGEGGANAKNLCNECNEEHVLEQYATTAKSAILSRNPPHEATGRPDAENCNQSPKAWQPDELVRDDCQDCAIFLQVEFKQAVVPQEITIWVPYHNSDEDIFTDIVLLYVDGSKESIGGGTAQCDSPFTKPVHVKKKVQKVQIYVSHQSVWIDAVKLTSMMGCPNCSKCKPLSYVLRRNPPFESGNERTISAPYLEDKNIDPNVRYEYRVRAVSHEKQFGPFSPPLIYESKRGFCGDGNIDEGENCDDGNVRDGDGCNILCQMEDVYRCTGRPSLCYRHDGDGVCEEFEKTSSIKDCGFFTPEGFKDQWAERAVAGKQYAHNCDVIGPPTSDLKCEITDFVHYPPVKCDKNWKLLKHADSSNGLTVYFKTPVVASAVVVYFSRITRSPYRPPPRMKFHLNGESHKISLEHQVMKYCKENPVVIPIHHDMSKPFFKTHFMQMIFDSDDVKIAAVALRSPNYFDHLGSQHCTGSQLFNPNTKKCHNYECKMPECPMLIVKHSTRVKGKCKKGSLDGEKCTLQCDRGFIPTKQFEVICLGGHWLVNGKVPQCMPVDCGTPKINNAETECPRGKTFGKKCTYRCVKGSKQVGSGADMSVTCESDGRWSEITRFCRKTCVLSTQPIHSKLLSSVKTCYKGKPFIPGESCKYRCKLGYRPTTAYIKDTNKKGDFVQRCLKDGEWSRIRCVPITCPVMEPNVFRWYNCNKGNIYGSVCSLSCPNEKVHFIKCGGGGHWNDTLRTCSTKGFCLPMAKIDTRTKMDLKITCDKSLKYKPGDECKITCSRGLRPVVMSGRTKMVVKSIECSPFLRWYPDIRKISCVAGCDLESKGDGHCDEGNNNASCEYDGGDCCDTDNCDENCVCIDPTSGNFGSDGSGGDFSS